MDDRRYHTKRWRKLARWVVARDGYQCSIAGCQSDMRQPGIATADHIKEPRDGGDFWDPHNLRALCRPHNLAKGIATTAHQREPTSPNA